MRIKIDIANGKNVFFISDFHLFHNNVLRFDKRPFNDVHEMHGVLKNNWNSVVSKKDVVFYLGDFTFGNHELSREFLTTLNGEIHLIFGNHDRERDLRYYPFKSFSDYIELTVIDKNSKYDFMLMHYPILSWNKKHHGSYMIHGHCHMGLSDYEFHQSNRIFDVGCNGWEYTPVSYKDILKRGKNIDFRITNNHHQ